MWPDDYAIRGNESEHPEEELAAFSLNALDDAEFQAVFHHVVKCLHCQEVLLGFQETSARLTGAAPGIELPQELKNRVLSGVTGRPSPPEAASQSPAPSLPPADGRWSRRRLRRWLLPAAVGTLSLLLAVAVGVMALQQREIDQLTAETVRLEQAVASAGIAPADAATAATADRIAPEPAAGAPVDATTHPPAQATHGLAAPGETATTTRDLSFAGAVATAPDVSAGPAGEGAPAVEAETVDHMKAHMAEVVEATVLSAQPETEKVPMTSPMGTEPTAKGVLMVEPNGRRGVLMVSGMPADTYQIWLLRGGHQVLVDRVVVNDDDGAGVKQLELDESIFHYQQVALMPDERHGPMNPTGERFLSALILQGPPMPPGR